MTQARKGALFLVLQRCALRPRLQRFLPLGLVPRHLWEWFLPDFLALYLDKHSMLLPTRWSSEKPIFTFGFLFVLLLSFLFLSFPFFLDELQKDDVFDSDVSDDENKLAKLECICDIVMGTL